MSLTPVGKNDFETFTVVTTPLRHYVSNSSGVTGAINLYARRSDIERDDTFPTAFIDGKYVDVSVEELLQYARSKIASSAGTNCYGLMSQYMSLVNSLGTRDRSKTLGVIRMVPPVEFTSDTLRKLVVKDILYKHHRAASPSMQWAYTNYHSLNFFTASCVPSDSVLLYPNKSAGQSGGYMSGAYVPSGAFSFDFYINPRYTTPDVDGVMRPGTILHLSSCYAVSLITGSSRDENGKPNAFRMLLQLSHSADVSPDVAYHGVYPRDLVFVSDDNSLRLNKWHHVVIRWGTQAEHGGSGSFNIDGVDAGTFCVVSSTIAPRVSNVFGNPDVLCVGNYYAGNNTGNNAQALFFATDPALREGLEELFPSTGVDEPSVFAFDFPLNAELHDVVIRNKYLTNLDIASSSSVGPATLDDTYMFYLPPFFTKKSPTRTVVSNMGGVLQTPFFAIDGATDDPFNVAMSFGVAGFYVNLENFLRDFANDVNPRAYHMTASIAASTVPKTADEVLYENPDVRRRNLLLMPCDDGKFVPNYSLLAAEDDTTKFVDSLGYTNLSLISLDNMLNDTSKLFGTSFVMGDKTESQGSELINVQIGATPEEPGASLGPATLNFANRSNRMVADGTYEQGVQADAPLTIYQRTLDASSNQIVIFDISNMLYGQQIHPGSVVITDAALSGSGGRVNVTLRDDGYGNLYRADASSACASWNSVGNVFYAEGIVTILSPHLCLFGKDGFELELRGEQNVHVLSIDAFAAANTAFSSSNATFVQLPPSGYANDPDNEFVYISNVYMHDDNFNVVGKATLAQPVMKRRGDKLVIKLRYDF